MSTYECEALRKTYLEDELQGRKGTQAQPFSGENVRAGNTAVNSSNSSKSNRRNITVSRTAAVPHPTFMMSFIWRLPSSSSL